ncbi:MAG: hypothetical protein M3O26_12320 [Pseudomonadota bacterium]|nr:hypothetical protein [Pseudomonadota bacterium]
MGRENLASAARAQLMALTGLAALGLGACASDSVVVTGTARAPISPAEVRIYSHPPATFQEVAILNASKNSAFTTGGQKTVDKVIAGLKEQAAKLGANGVILEGFSDRQTGAVGSGVGSDSYSRSSAVGVGVGGSLGLYKKTGHGIAIFVPPGSSADSNVLTAPGRP